MAIYAVVPVKNLGVSKRRLSTVFNPQERRQLTLAMLEDVLNALRASVVDKTVVIGEDLQVKQMAEKMGAAYLEASRPGLNSAIEEATQWCTQHHANSVLVLPADVPSLSSKEINRIVELGKGNLAVVLSPSKNWGTNALYQNPPNLIPACFGPKSFLKHIKKAYSAEVSVRLHFSSGTARDIDSAKDLKEFFEIENSTACKNVLQQITLGNKKAREYFYSNKK